MTEPYYAKGFWNPYVAGFVLGLVLLATFYIMGTGLGASGAFSRTAAVTAHAIDSNWVESNGLFKSYYANKTKSPLVNWMVFEVIGVFIGGVIAVVTARRFRPEVAKGAHASKGTRMALAVVGGILAGIGTRLALGCTSGQALSGGATMVVGSWVFMMALFATAFIAAIFLRRQWS